MRTIGAGISIKLLFQNIIFFKIYRLGGGGVNFNVLRVSRVFMTIVAIEYFPNVLVFLFKT